MSAWLIWLIVAAALAAAETLSLDLVLIMLAGGAGGACVAAAAGGGLPVQAGVFVGVSVLLLGGLRPVAKRHIDATTGHRFGAEALVGTSAVVLEEVDATDGRVRLNGSVWSARTDLGGQPIPPGATVRVLKIDGATAIVYAELA